MLTIDASRSQPTQYAARSTISTGELHSLDIPGCSWIFILIESTDLFDLPLVALISTGDVVGQRLRASKVVVAAGGGDDVALAGDLAGESGYRTGDCAVMLV